MKFTPNGTRILVSKAEDKETKVGGIVVPASAPHSIHTHKSVVEAVGPKVESFAVGDVIVHPVAGYELTIEGKGYRVLDEADVIGRLN